MAQQWEVIGGSVQGGILVRAGKELKSTQFDDRLATGSIIEQIELIGDRLRYKVIAADSGPPEGWVSIKISGKDLVVPKNAAPSGTAPVDGGGPADSSSAVEVDAVLKKRVEDKAAEMKKKDMFSQCCFKYKILGGPAPDPKLRVICFHNAGSAESVFTAPSTDLAKFIKASKTIEMVAVDYPGRDKIKDVPMIANTLELAEWLLAVIHDKIADGVPYLVWGHSVGTWIAFEFMMLARQIGLPMPRAAFLNAFPAPHMEVKKRPWRRSKTLDGAEIKKELMSWDESHFLGAGKVVFDEPAWKETFEPMMRSDFQLYDEYEFKHGGAPKFDFPLHCWHMEGEKLNKQDMIELWKDWTTADFDTRVIKDMGHLTCFYKPEFKKVYFEQVQSLITKYAGL